MYFKCHVFENNNNNKQIDCNKAHDAATYFIWHFYGSKPF